MIKILLTFIGCLLFLYTHGQNLDNHKWKDRILIVKADTESSIKYQNQIKELSNSSDDLKERKLITYQVVGSRYKLFDYEHQKLIESGDISNHLSEVLLSKKNPFEIILIGLDGGIKLKRTELVKKEELFNLIDSMPMRSSELRNKN